jgi:hypothetical protein
MAHFALVQNGVVQRVETVVTDVIRDADGVAQETVGRAFLASCHPGTQPSEWIRTHYPVNQPSPYPRGKYAGVGDVWDGTQFTAPAVETI